MNPSSGSVCPEMIELSLSLIAISIFECAPPGGDPSLANDSKVFLSSSLITTSERFLYISWAMDSRSARSPVSSFAVSISGTNSSAPSPLLPM